MFLTLSVVALSLTAPPIQFKDGDRIVWIGSTIAEREQRYGHWETALLRSFRDRTITVRNLGWSGDTVFGDARAGFDTPAKGYERLVSLTAELNPSIIFISYGSNESFEGANGVAKFEKGLAKLLDSLAPTKARIVLFTPMAVEKSPSRPDVTSRNEQLRLYATAIRDVGETRGHFIADLFSASYTHVTKSPEQRFTDNGMHLTDAGYSATIPDFLSTLGLSWAGDDPKAFEATRVAVQKKNELFFHRWRPQNETYLFGFRKHEQGKNAKEIVEFDPLIEAAESAVRATLKK